jgi:hypothetical protein
MDDVAIIDGDASAWQAATKLRAAGRPSPEYLHHFTSILPTGLKTSSRLRGVVRPAMTQRNYIHFRGVNR